jgi:RND family efflux transporter MFP subunit
MQQLQQPVRGSPKMAAFVLSYPSLLAADLRPAARRLRRGSSSGMALRLALCLLWLACAATAQPVQDQARPAATPVPVIVAKASAVTDAARLEVLGSGLAQRAAVLRPAVAGEVTAVRFQAGDRVASGQTLVQLDDRAEKLAVALARNRVQVTQQLLTRYENTGTTGAVPPSVIDEARSMRRIADIELQRAQVALADRAVRAPFAGVIGLAQVKPGDRVTPDTVLATLDDRRQLRVAFELPERYLSALAVGRKLSVSTSAWPEQRFDGRVAEIDSRVDPATRQIRLQAAVPNVGDRLRPGMSFSVRLSLPGEPLIMIPELALQWGREGSFVWTVREGRAVKVMVRSVRREAGQVLIDPRADSRIGGGETVVVEGVQRLREGHPVQIVGMRQVAPAQPAASSPVSEG